MNHKKTGKQDAITTHEEFCEAKIKAFSLIKSGGIALALALVAIPPSWADDDSKSKNCTLASLKGSYGYSEQGVSVRTSTTGTSTTYISEAGIIEADGHGHLSSTASAIWAPFIPGIQQPLTLVFSTTAVGEGYTVNPDCTGDAKFSVTVTDANKDPVNLGGGGPDGNILPGRTIHFVIDSHKSEFKFVSTSPGTVATGSANKQ